MACDGSEWEAFSVSYPCSLSLSMLRLSYIQLSEDLFEKGFSLSFSQLGLSSFSFVRKIDRGPSADVGKAKHSFSSVAMILISNVFGRFYLQSLRASVISTKSVKSIIETIAFFSEVFLCLTRQDKCHWWAHVTLLCRESTNLNTICFRACCYKREKKFSLISFRRTSMARAKAF